ncbi:MAG: hypothetical protein ACI9U2_002772 [Bradymonadia bacterium]
MATAPLDAAAACYEALDYDCAEARLVEALARPLPLKQTLAARRLDALLAFAFRDDARVRRAARAIFALQPDFQPTGMPPQLARIFEIERPTPPPPPGLHARLDMTVTTLTGNDADRWSYGLGAAGEVGVRLFDRLIGAIGLRWDDHPPLEFVQNGLTTFGVEAIVAWRQPVGPLRVMGGLSAGAMRVDIDGALNDATYWGGIVSGVIDLSWPVWREFGIGVRCAPTLFMTSEADRLASSSLIPLTFGLRYGP